MYVDTCTYRKADKYIHMYVSMSTELSNYTRYCIYVHTSNLLYRRHINWIFNSTYLYVILVLGNCCRFKDRYGRWWINENSPYIRTLYVCSSLQICTSPLCETFRFLVALLKFLWYSSSSYADIEGHLLVRSSSVQDPQVMKCTRMMSGISFQIEERIKTQSGEENSDEKFSSPDCVFKRSSIRKDIPDFSWKFRSPKSLFDCVQ